MKLIKIFTLLIYTNFFTTLAFVGNSNLAPISIKNKVVESHIKKSSLPLKIWTVDELLDYFGNKELPPLITGATGFIGYNLINKLLSDNFQTIALLRSTNKIDKFRDIKNNKNLFIVKLNDGYNSEKLKKFEKLIKKSPLIFHLAATINTEVDTLKDVEDIFFNNILYTSILTKFVELYNKKLIYISSAHIYTFYNNYDSIITEDTQIPFSLSDKKFIKSVENEFNEYIDYFIKNKSIKSPEKFIKEFIDNNYIFKPIMHDSKQILNDFQKKLYSLSKIIPEKFVLNNIKSGNSIVLRLTNVFGPGQNDTSVIGLLINRLKYNKPIFITKDTRDFIYISDVINAIYKAKHFLLKNAKNNEMFIISSNNPPFTMEKLLIVIRKLLNKNNYPYSINMSSKKQILPKISNEKAKKLIKWEPKITLIQGLNKFVENEPLVKISSQLIDYWETKLKEFIGKTKAAFNYEEFILTEQWMRVFNILNSNYNFLPNEIEIQPARYCNLKCAHCIGLKKLPKGSKTQITPELLEKTINDLYVLNKNNPKWGKIDFIKFSGFYSDPLITKKTTLRGLSIASKLGFKVGLFTNGVLMDKEVRNYLVDYAYYVHVSLDAYNNDSFKTLKGGKKGDFDKIIENLNELVKLAKVKKSKLININVGYVIGKENMDGIVSIAKILKKIGVRLLRFKVDIRPDRSNLLNENDRKKIIELLNEVKKLGSENFKVVIIHNQDEISGRIIKPTFKNCWFSHFFTSFAHTEKIHICDHNSFPNGKNFGSVRELGFEKVWKDRIKYLASFKPENYCKICPPMGARINTLLEFLNDQKNRYPLFMKWLQIEFLPKLMHSVRVREIKNKNFLKVKRIDVILEAMNSDGLTNNFNSLSNIESIFENFEIMQTLKNAA